MFLDRDESRRTAWPNASEKGQIELLNKLWEWAKDLLISEEIQNIFLARDESKRTAWHMALEEGHIDVFHNLWEWPK